MSRVSLGLEGVGDHYQPSALLRPSLGTAEPVESQSLGLHDSETQRRERLWCDGVRVDAAQG